MVNKLPLQWLLKLPPALRCQAISPLTVRPSERQIFARKTIKNQPFSTTRSLLARSSKPTKSSPNKQKPPPQINNVTQSRPPPRTPISTFPQHIQYLLETKGSVLLYRAPNHSSFFINSYLLGSTFILGAVVQAGFIDRDREMPWYIRSVTAGLALFWAAVGTAFILGPSKMIRAVHLVARSPDQGHVGLRFQTRSTIPFINRLRGTKNVIETPLKEVFIGEKIFAEDIPYRNVPISSAEAFTDSYVNPPKLSIRERFDGFGKAVVNIFPVLWQDTRRMFLRDAMAYLSIPGRGNWKLDLYDAELLDSGRPLMAAMFLVEELDRSWVTRITNLFGR